MCYSAQLEQAYKTYVRKHGADIDIHAFAQLYGKRRDGEKIRIPKAMDASFAQPETEIERQIHAMIAAYDADETAKLQQELFKQARRLADAERTLRVKQTKKALDDQRIATAKIAWCKGKLSDLRRADLIDEDARIFPGWYAPVLVVEDGRRVVKPMRYQCLPAGKPASFDAKFPGTYNARRDSLEGFWKGVFGRTHGVVVMHAFYENVSRHAAEGRDLREGEREENVVLEFRPKTHRPMLAACVWSHWTGAGRELTSFAAITDTPPPEIAAAGHDRCIVPIKPEHVDAWLHPDPRNLAALYAILDDRERPYYEHRIAA